MKTLQQGDYCEVTEEQAVELFKTEGELLYPERFVRSIVQSENYGPLTARFDSCAGIVISTYHTGDNQFKIEFSDFRERLINTLQTA